VRKYSNDFTPSQRDAYNESRRGSRTAESKARKRPKRKSEWQNTKSNRAQKKEDENEWIFRLGVNSQQTRAAQLFQHIQEELSSNGLDIEWDKRTGKLSRIIINEKGSYLVPQVPRSTPRSWN